MASRIRCWEPGVPLSCVRRTVDRQFLLRPDEINRNIIGASIGRAQQKFPVEIFCFEHNVNHLHPVIAPIEGQEDNVSRFFQNFGSNTARAINKRWQREGALWAGRVRCEPVLDDESLEQQLIYAVTNPVKDGLVDRVSHYPGFSVYPHLAHGEPLRFSYVDLRLWHKHGGPRNRRPLSDYERWVDVEVSPLPAWRDMPEHQRQARFRRLVRDAEDELRDRREHEHRTVVGVPALKRLEPRDKPRNPKRSGRQPLCHASSAERRRDFARRHRALRRAHAEASARYRSGQLDAEFPPYTFRPPLITLQTSSGL